MRLSSSIVVSMTCAAPETTPRPVTVRESSVCSTDACAVKSFAFWPVSAASWAKSTTRPVIGSLTARLTMARNWC